jgi:hypothetical protein
MVEEHELSKDKNDTEMSKLDFQLSEQAVSKIEELNVMFEKQKSLHGKRKALILKLLETLREDGFKDHQIVDIVLDRVKGVSRSTIYAALPQEVKREYTKPLPKTINVTTAHKVIDVPVAGTTSTKQLEITEEKINTEEDEEPTPLEIAEIRIQQLEEALHKTEQFKPATQLEAQPRQMTIDECFDFLPDDSAMTCWKINRIAGNALKNRISAWQGNTTKIFRVWMQEV